MVMFSLGGKSTNLYIYIIIIIDEAERNSNYIGEIERNSNYNSKLEFQFNAMCPKIFIFNEFNFLILESNVGPHHKYLSKWVIKYKNQIV